MNEKHYSEWRRCVWQHCRT